MNPSIYPRHCCLAGVKALLTAAAPTPAGTRATEPVAICEWFVLEVIIHTAAGLSALQPVCERTCKQHLGILKAQKHYALRLDCYWEACCCSCFSCSTRMR